jgi:predicted phage gp36 major capsid-like protein
LARKRELAEAEDEIRANKVPLAWGDFNQRLNPAACRRAGFD